MGVAIGALLGISIHALREEGDSVVRPKAGAMWRFLSTPSARRATLPAGTPSRSPLRFLSTPSARRATSPGPFSEPRR